MPRYLGAGGVIITTTYPPASELGFARGPMPGGAVLRTPAPLSRAEQTYARPELLGPAETIGDVGGGQAVGSRAPVSPESRGGGQVVRGAGGVFINLAVGAAVRAAGLPGIVATALNFIIGAVRKNAGTTTTEASSTAPDAFAPTAFGDLLRDRDPWAESTAQARAESAARGTRIDALLATFEDTDDEVVVPSSVPSNVPEEQALPSPGLDTETGAPYGGGDPASQDVPGPDFPV